MPPFILEKQKCNPLDYRRKTTLYCKKLYNPNVKISAWDNFQTSQPIDTNPMCPEAYNLHHSHYNHFGTNYDIKWSTTTGDMSKEVLRHDLEINPNYTLVNIYTSTKYCQYIVQLPEPNVHVYISRGTCSDVQTVCSAANCQNFLTTMQCSFQPPYPYKLRRLAMPEIPHLLNRRLTNNGICQFLDDDYGFYTQRLQANKTSRFISYNPCTGYYTDGSSGNAQERKCAGVN